MTSPPIFVKAGPPTRFRDHDDRNNCSAHWLQGDPPAYDMSLIICTNILASAPVETTGLQTLYTSISPASSFISDLPSCCFDYKVVVAVVREATAAESRSEASSLVRLCGSLVIGLLSSSAFVFLAVVVSVLLSLIMVEFQQNECTVSALRPNLLC